MNHRFKRVIETALTASGVARIHQARLPTTSVLILAYHDIVPFGIHCGGDASLHLPQGDFARQLDLITRTHAVVPLSSIFNEPVGAHPRVAITFDDAYAGALTAGVEELERRRLPATVFVAPALLNEIAWWDVLAEHDAGVPAARRDQALWELAGRQDSVLAGHIPSEARQRGRLPRIGTLTQLDGAAKYSRLDIASHTWSHVNLPALDPIQLALELSRPIAWLSSRFPGSLPLLSYPYGLYSRTVELAAALAGYERAFRVDGGWIRDVAATDPFAVPRYNVPARLSLNGLRLRLADIGAAG